MGDIDRVSRIAAGRFLNSSERVDAVNRKENDQDNPSQKKQDQQEHPDQVELHTKPPAKSDEKEPAKKKVPSRPTQQNHLDIEA